MKNNIITLSICFLLSASPLITLGQTTPPAPAEAEGSAVKEFFRTLLFCGPGNKMCDKDYNPNAKNAMVESPEQIIDFFNQVKIAYISQYKLMLLELKVESQLAILFGPKFKFVFNISFLFLFRLQ